MPANVRVLNQAGAAPIVLEGSYRWDTAWKTALNWTNFSTVPMAFNRFEIINGSTAGATTAPIVTLHTPNCDYTLTFPSTTTDANQVMAQDAVGLDLIASWGIVTITVDATPATAKEFKYRVVLQPMPHLDGV